MKRTPSQLQLKCSEDNDYEKGEETKGMLPGKEIEGEEDDDEIDDIAARVQCMSIHKREPTKRGEEVSWEKYGLWRQEQKSRTARLEKQLKSRWALEELIDEQLNRYHAHYNRAMVPTRIKDVSHLLMPKWAPPHELASLSWMGDWRPSAILDLLRALTHSWSSLSSSSFSDSIGVERILSQVTHEIRIEEAVIDEEMAEIQATCVLHLPFAPVKKQLGLGSAAALACVQSEFKKIERVITKAQQLRFKALELVVKKVLGQTDAAEFLVSFAGIHDTIHQFAAHQRFRKGPVSLPVKALWCN